MRLLTKTKSWERLTWVTSNGSWSTTHTQAFKARSTAPNSKFNGFWVALAALHSTRSSCWQRALSARWLWQPCLSICPWASTTKKVKSQRPSSISAPPRAKSSKLVLRRREATKPLHTHWRSQSKRTKPWLTKSEAFRRQNTLTWRLIKSQDCMSWIASVSARWRTSCTSSLISTLRLKANPWFACSSSIKTPCQNKTSASSFPTTSTLTKKSPIKLSLSHNPSPERLISIQFRTIQKLRRKSLQETKNEYNPMHTALVHMGLSN